MMRINGKRLLADLRELASIGAFKTGVDRIALSAKDIEARRWLVGKLAAAGLKASMDRVGNVLGRDPNAKKAILVGSHTDTVPKGGWLDGALGVCYALEIARSAIEANAPHATGIDAISFEDEEGTYLPFLGSRSFFGELDDHEITAAKSKDGASLAPALATIAAEPPPHRFDAGRYVGYLEAHIEQGPRMEAGGNRIAVVTGLVGIKRFRVLSHGSANHAGTTPMAMRKDAGAALIALAAGIERGHAPPRRTRHRLEHRQHDFPARRGEHGAERRRDAARISRHRRRGDGAGRGARSWRGSPRPIAGR